MLMAHLKTVTLSGLEATEGGGGGTLRNELNEDRCDVHKSKIHSYNATYLFLRTLGM